MGVIFLSDAHLRNKGTHPYRAFLEFLAHLGEGTLPGGEKVDVTDLYLLGDTFDFWFARGRAVYPEFDIVLEKLIALQQSGIAIHLFEGNHDFFLTAFFRGYLGMDVYEDWGAITMDGFRFLLGHGDLVDRDDKGYLFLRRILRSRWFNVFQNALPSRLVWRLARYAADLGQGSRERGNEKLATKMQEFAVTCHARGFDVVILGHCHLPMVYENRQDGRIKYLVLLGDWIRHFTFLHYSDGKLSLRTVSGVHIGSGQLML